MNDTNTLKEVKIALLQCASEMGNVKKNLSRLTRYCQEAAKAGAKILVLPEACVPGYLSEDLKEVWYVRDRPIGAGYLPRELTSSIAEPVNGPCVLYFAQLAQELQVYITVPFIEVDDQGHFYNAISLVGPYSYPPPPSAYPSFPSSSSPLPSLSLSSSSESITSFISPPFSTFSSSTTTASCSSSLFRGLSLKSTAETTPVCSKSCSAFSFSKSAARGNSSSASSSTAAAAASSAAPAPSSFRLSCKSPSSSSILSTNPPKTTSSSSASSSFSSSSASTSSTSSFSTSTSASSASSSSKVSSLKSPSHASSLHKSVAFASPSSSATTSKTATTSSSAPSSPKAALASSSRSSAAPFSFPVLAHYRKNCPWPTPEKSWATPGEGVDGAIFDTEYGRIGLAVCFDIHSILAKYYDKGLWALLYPIAWVGSVEFWFLRGLPDRLAKVNCPFHVLGANWGTRAPMSWTGAGGSTAYGPQGKIISTALSNGGAEWKQQIVYATIPTQPYTPRVGSFDLDAYNDWTRTQIDTDFWSHGLGAKILHPGSTSNKNSTRRTKSLTAQETKERM